MATETDAMQPRLGLRAVVQELLAELEVSPCTCSVAARLEGHDVDCNWPGIQAAAAAVKEALDD